MDAFVIGSIKQLNATILREQISIRIKLHALNFEYKCFF